MSMQLAFHWVRVQVFCYATERQELLEETLVELLGTDEFTEDVSEGEHGDTMLILEARLTKQREYNALFRKLGSDIREWIKENGKAPPNVRTSWEPVREMLSLRKNTRLDDW